MKLIGVAVHKGVFFQSTIGCIIEKAIKIMAKGMKI